MTRSARATSDLKHECDRAPRHSVERLVRLLAVNACIRRSVSQNAANHNRVPQKKVAIVIPELKGSIRIDRDRFQRHSSLELLCAQLLFILFQPSFVLELEKFSDRKISDSLTPANL